MRLGVLKFGALACIISGCVFHRDLAADVALLKISLLILARQVMMNVGNAVPPELEKSRNVFKIKRVLKYLVVLASSWVQVACLPTSHSPSLPW